MAGDAVPPSHRHGLHHHHFLEHVALPRVRQAAPPGGFFISREQFMRTIEVFDTTLRDGLQVEGVSATVDDKLRIAEQLDFLGVHYIEGGWPGANPKDIEFFARAATELRLDTSTLVAFGSTRRPRGKVDDDPTLRNLVETGTSAVCIVAKSSAYHVTEALQTTLAEGEAMIADSVRFLRDSGRRVLVDMEHFFDGYKAD